MHKNMPSPLSQAMATLKNRHASGQGARLLAHSRFLQGLDRRLREVLPAELVQHCTVANLRDGQLILAADSPAWGARLRFHVPRLQKQLQPLLGASAARILVRVLPISPPPGPRPPRPAPQLSAGAGSMLAQSARHISDPGLQAALLRLAARARRD